MQSNKPDKQVVHDYMQRRIEQQHTKEHVPPPSPAEVRRQLGWFISDEKDCGR